MSPHSGAAARIEIVADAEELARRGAGEVAAALASALARRPYATWVLAGGSTPRLLYQRLAAQPRALDWSRVELYWGDERCVPPADERSNFRLARRSLLAGLPFAASRVHRIRGELPATVAADEYQGEIAAALARGPFDLVLLGLGADGHTASLFPGWVAPRGVLAAAVEAPVEPRRRVTLTAAALRRCRRLLFLVAGRDKAAAVARALDPVRTGEVSAAIRPPAGDTVWLLDRAAAAQL